MKKSSKFLLHVPDAICFYRALASVMGLLLGVHWLTPWLFSTALISDLWDGWFYRKYVGSHPDWKPWSPLPITFDPLADLTLIVCGIAFGVRYYLALDFKGVMSIAMITVVVCAIFALSNQLARRRHYHTLGMISATLQTHISCFLMVYTAAITWKVVHGSWRGGIITVAIFYGIFLAIGDKSRLIRRI